MLKVRPSVLMALLAAAFPFCAFAQQAPDAGQILQQQQSAPQLPRSAPSIELQAPAATPTAPGGARVTVRGVRLAGNTVFSEAELLAVLGDFADKDYDLAGLRALADRISLHYLEAGYPFGRAYLPRQSSGDGVLHIEVVEGRYGAVRVVGEEPLVRPAEAFLTRLKPGDVIEARRLEQATLVLDDLPGIMIGPILRPGREVGTGDLDVRIQRTPGVGGEVGFDNHGSRFTGAHRIRANLQWDSPFGFGDQIALRTLYSDEDMWQGSLNYSRPLGSSGLRANIGYSHTYYELGKDFAELGATGTAKVSSLGLSYPIIRSASENLGIGATLQNKRLNDKQQQTGSDDDKSSDSVLVSLNFDRRDGLLGGGVTYGSLSYTTGRLSLGSVLEATDRASGQNTRGRFDKWNLDLARVQATPLANLTLFGRVSAQRAGKNLDSSEGFSLGGANGVRAYPSGEGTGYEGWLVQMEIRYAMGPLSPYLFHDAGRVTLNANNGNLTTPASPNYRSLGGEGFGIRYAGKGWNLDANVSWRSHGGVPQSDTAKRNPRAWLALGYRF